MPAKRPTSLRLGYFGNVTHAQAVFGDHSGEFAKAVAPASFTTKVFNAGPSLVEALFAGEIDMGYVGPGPAISAFEKSRGEKIRVLAGASANGVLIVARKDSGISTLADLKGRKVATPQQGNTQDISAKHYLLKVLGQADTDNVIAIANAEQAGDDAARPDRRGLGGRALGIGAGAAGRGEGDRRGEGPLAQQGTDAGGGHHDARVPQGAPRSGGEAARGSLLVDGAPVGRSTEACGSIRRGVFALNGKKLPAGVLEESLKHVKFTNDPLEETLAAMARWSYELGFARQEPKLEGLVDLSVLKKGARHVSCEWSVVSCRSLVLWSVATDKWTRDPTTDH